MKIWSVGLLLFFIPFIITPPSAFAEGLPPEAFHAPQTEAEKALNNIQTQEKKNPDMGRYLTKNDADKESPFLTKKFMQTAKGRNKALEHCSDENPCISAGFNPLTCGAQDSSEYDQLFHTIKENTHEAIIMSTWREHLYPSIEGPIYKMVKDGKVWKLDGVACGENRFNVE